MPPCSARCAPRTSARTIRSPVWSCKENGSARRSSQEAAITAPLDGCLPDFVLAALREAFPLFDKKLRGYAMPDAVLTGVETRSSSPVRIVRGGNGQSNLRGVYPCGEGAGYAGGILSAAVDGIRQAENWLSQHME